jgi:hypothetical protein
MELIMPNMKPLYDAMTKVKNSMKGNNTMKLTDYYDLLAKHNWYYNFSDDNRVWRAGEINLTHLLNIAHESAAHAELYRQFEEYHFSGSAFDKPAKPMPIKPKE